MKNLILLFSIFAVATGVCIAQTSGFTYQGRLGDNGAPANGTYQFECKLFDDVTPGNQVGPTQIVVATVQNGIFTTRLDFGSSAFVAGQDRWLEISVRQNGSSDRYGVKADSWLTTLQAAISSPERSVRKRIHPANW